MLYRIPQAVRFKSSQINWEVYFNVLSKHNNVKIKRADATARILSCVTLET